MEPAVHLGLRLAGLLGAAWSRVYYLFCRWLLLLLVSCALAVEIELSRLLRHAMRLAQVLVLGWLVGVEHHQVVISLVTPHMARVDA